MEWQLPKKTDSCKLIVNLVTVHQFLNKGKAMLVFSVAFLVVVDTGQTDLPRWAGIFNLLPLAVVTLPTKLPAKANVMGAVMFLGLLFLM